MRLTLVITVVIGGTAVAQPGQAPIVAPAPLPYGPPPMAYLPPPNAYQQQPLTADEAELLGQGEISDGQHAGGGLAAVVIGFGVGQAVQGRWRDTGWIFTVGEIAATSLFFYGVLDGLTSCDESCSDSTSNRIAVEVAGSMIAFAGLRVWETIDAFVVPPRHNRRLRELRQRLGMPPIDNSYAVLPYVGKPHGDGGGVVGLTLRF